jgi:tripeptidyl-peptidase-1
MRTISCFVCFIVLITIVNCNRSVLRTRFDIPNEWDKLERINNNEIVEFTIALRQRNLDMLNEVFEDRTNPLSKNFRQWLSIQEIQAIIAPKVEDVARVFEWLNVEGIEATPYGDFIKVEGKVETVEKLLQTELYHYQNNQFKHLHMIRQFGNLSIPSDLTDIIEMITGLSEFVPAMAKLSRRQTREPEENFEYWVVPQTLRAMYNVSTTISATNSKTSQAVVEFSPRSGISFDDLFQFQDLTNQKQQNISYIVGDFRFSPINPVDDESTLDVQYIMAMAPGADCSYWTVDGWLYDFATLVQQRQSNNQPVPYVFSVSYGWSEYDQCEITGDGTSCAQLGGTSKDYVTRTNTEFQKISLTGVTVVVASGDAGAATKWNQKCTQTPEIGVEYPAGCPYVTTVGATMLDPAKDMTTSKPPFCENSEVPCAVGGDEIVCSIPFAGITSGGGFSAYAPALSFQEKAVQNWQAQNCIQPPSNMFNSANRGEPDVSTLGHAYMIVHANKTLPVDGTSASAPVFAGMLTLLNDQLFNSNQNSLGFFNPTLYSMYQYSSQTFQDITVGNNTATMAWILHPDGCTTPGYSACEGWDPVSGFGSPNFGLISDYLAQN